MRGCLRWHHGAALLLWLSLVPQHRARGDRPARPAPARPPLVRFVAVGDTGTGSRAQWAVAAAMQRKCAQDGCDFIQLLGDNIYETGVESIYDYQWLTKFEAPYQDIKLPFFAILGNHDYGGDGGGNQRYKGLLQVDYTARSGKWRMPAPFYMRTVRHVDFYGIDTTSLRLGRDVEAQRQAVRQWLSRSTSGWRIAFGHHPYLSNGPHGTEDLVRPHSGAAQFRDFIERELCGRIDVYIAGHDHSRQWLVDTCAGTDLVVSGAGASATTLPGRNPAHFQAATLGFLYVAIRGGTLRAEFVNQDGAVEFARSITK